MSKRSLAWLMIATLLMPTPVLAATADPVPTRVVVFVSGVDAEEAGKFQSSRYEDLFRVAIEADPEALEVGGASTNRLAGETAAFMFFFSMGFGLIGGTQAAIQEGDRVAALGGPVRGRMAEQRANQGLDRRFADAVGEALAGVASLRVDGPVELVATSADLEAPGTDRQVMRWVDRNHGRDPRGLLVVSLRHGTPENLSGVYGIAGVWSFVPPGLAKGKGQPKRPPNAPLRPDYFTHHADGTPRKAPITSEEGDEAERPVATGARVTFVGSQEHALFATPVPLADLKEPPAGKVAAETAAINAKYDPLIESSKDRDLRRDLRGQRNRELAKAAKWYPVSFAQHMHDAWLAPPGDAYARLMARAQADLARRIAAGLDAAP